MSEDFNSLMSDAMTYIEPPPLSYYLVPARKTLDPDTGDVVSCEWGMLDGDGEVVSAVTHCPLGLKTVGENDTHLGVSVPANPQGVFTAIDPDTGDPLTAIGPWSPLAGWTSLTLEEIQNLFGGE